VQAAAFKHFGDQADEVACFNAGPFRYHHGRYHEYGCKAIRGGHLQNDETYCVMLHQGSPIPDDAVAAILSARHIQRLRCGG
jgi:hypothetical protein